MCIAPCGFFLRLWYPKGNLVAVRRSHKGTFFLGGCEPCEDVAECDTVMPGSQLKNSDRDGRGGENYVFTRTPNEGPHSLAMTFERPVTPAFARP